MSCIARRRLFAATQTRHDKIIARTELIKLAREKRGIARGRAAGCLARACGRRRKVRFNARAASSQAVGGSTLSSLKNGRCRRPIRCAEAISERIGHLCARSFLRHQRRPVTGRLCATLDGRVLRIQRPPTATRCWQMRLNQESECCHNRTPSRARSFDRVRRVGGAMTARVSVCALTRRGPPEITDEFIEPDEMRRGKCVLRRHMGNTRDFKISDDDAQSVG